MTEVTLEETRAHLSIETQRLQGFGTRFSKARALLSGSVLC